MPLEILLRMINCFFTWSLLQCKFSDHLFFLIIAFLLLDEVSSIFAAIIENSDLFCFTNQLSCYAHEFQDKQVNNDLSCVSVT